ncbi:MAG: TIGR00730 family Rossman fold protein [Oscillospiraceae bacterium]|nr:TIGR00730 family Rossman fold protein [Oscillospiraceae bacterium]
MKICVFGASGHELDRAYFDAAAELGRLLGRQGHTLVFGAGDRGLMGACAHAAAAEGAEIIGVAPRFFDEPGILYQSCSRLILTETMRERKALMEELAEAFIVMPGGIGTLEEFFEVLTLRQLGRHSKPIALLNTCGCYDALLTLLQRTARERFMSADCLSLFALCPDPSSALAYALQPQEPVRRSLRDYTK